MRIKQVDQLLDLLELFAKDRTPLTLTQLSQELGMPKSSTFNLIDTLLVRGFLYETRQRGGYYPTRRIQDLASDIMDGDTVLDSLHGELEALSQDTGETALLAIRQGSEVVYVDVVEAEAPIRYNARVGDRRPIYTASSGKAILSSYTEDERHEIVASLDFAVHQKSTIRTADQLMADLSAAIRRGWCEDRAEFTPDVMGIGVPLLHGGRRFGLAVAGPIYRLRQHRAELAGRLQDAVTRMQMTFQGRR
jgi:DNA-binding IclR family transcriptional regulator